LILGRQEVGQLTIKCPQSIFSVTIFSEQISPYTFVLTLLLWVFVNG
jgi:hypothetical protein